MVCDELKKHKEPVCPCPPGSCKKKENKGKLVSFILGLNDNYMDIRGQIMRMKPPPTLDMTYSMILWKNNRGPLLMLIQQHCTSRAPNNQKGVPKQEQRID